MKDRLVEPEYAFFFNKHELSVEGVPLSGLADRYGTPLYVYSGAAIRESHRRIHQAMKGIPIQICYAVKANSNLSLLRFLSDLGVGCDLVSYGEWYRAERAGIPRALRVLSGVAKTAEEFDRLLKLPNAGVGSIHIESVMEFELLQVLARYRKQPVTVALRYNPNVDAKTHDKISTGRKKDKFGLTREEILDLCVNEGGDEWVRISGLSVHIGSQIKSLEPFRKAFRQLSGLCDEVEGYLGRKLDYVDLGGGVGVPYRKGESTIALSEYAELIRSFFYGKKRKYGKILLEPGRSLVANAGVLVSEVVYSKSRPGHHTLILDAGMNDLMRPALYEAYHEILPLDRSGKVKSGKWDVVGGICETSDSFARRRPLAVEGLPGERVAILSAGAYGFSMSNTYNTRPLVAEVLVDQGKVKLIRKRQTLDQLIDMEI
jgi:diaminopimelate decarboxylase